MANKQLFQKTTVPVADTLNEAGGLAYALSPKHALAQYAVTGCLNATFYAEAQTQLDQVLALCGEIEPAFIAKTAIYARRQGYMKDMPALLTVWLAAHGAPYLPMVFKQVIDNGKMLRNFVQILRSGAVGRQSLGSLPKRLVQDWLSSRSPAQLIAASIGQNPSLADVIKMVHPKPADKAREALYAYLIAKPCEASLLPLALQDYLAFKAGQRVEVPDLPFQLLTALDLTSQQWVGIACQAPWQMTRMNLNTFARHGVFKVGGMSQRIAERLRDPALIAKARVFPYQLLSAYYHCADGVPGVVRDALREAMELSLANVPKVDGKIVVLVDVSGSMQAPVTGYRKGASSTVRCVDVAALFASAILAKNPQAEVWPFDTRVHNAKIKQQDGVLYNAAKLAKFGGGGTDCSMPLLELNARKAKADLVVFVSDNESWLDTAQRSYWRQGATQVLKEWTRFKARNPQARLACIDIQPYRTVQAPERDGILNIGGFSDAVFRIIATYAQGRLDAGHWVGQIEAVALDNDPIPGPSPSQREGR